MNLNFFWILVIVLFWVRNSQDFEKFKMCCNDNTEIFIFQQKSYLKNKLYRYRCV